MAPASFTPCICLSLGETSPVMPCLFTPGTLHGTNGTRSCQAFKAPMACATRKLPLRQAACSKVVPFRSRACGMRQKACGKHETRSPAAPPWRWHPTASASGGRPDWKCQQRSTPSQEAAGQASWVKQPCSRASFSRHAYGLLVPRWKPKQGFLEDSTCRITPWHCQHCSYELRFVGRLEDSCPSFQRLLAAE